MIILYNNDESEYEEFTTTDGAKFAGQCLDGVPHGNGTLALANGTGYVGEFQDGYPWGKGRETRADGTTHEGEWIEGRIHGMGVTNWPDGSRYVGEFRDHKYHGIGTYYYSDGAIYVGNWSNGKRHGFGKLSNTKIGDYSGEWIEDKPSQPEILEFTFLDGNPKVRIDDYIKHILENDNTSNTTHVDGALDEDVVDSVKMHWPRDVEFCILDFETTGLMPQFGDRIVEYAYLIVKNGQIIERGEELVNPNRPMNPGATSANGITDEMLRGKPRFDQVGGELWHAINNRVVLAHNARFDLNCLAYECKKIGWPQPDFQAIDSLKLSRSLWTGQPNNKLETLAKLVGHTWSGNSHRAMADVEALFTVMDRMFSQFPSRLNSLNAIVNLGGVEKTSTDILPTHNMSRTAQILIQNRGNPMQIQYNSKSSGYASRTITPIEVFVNNNVEFVEAYCHKRLTNRTFRVDRIYSV